MVYFILKLEIYNVYKTYSVQSIYDNSINLLKTFELNNEY